MGLFNRLNDKVKARESYQSDKPGTYLQRIDAITEEETEAKQGFVKVHKTTIAVLDTKDGKAHKPDAETSHAYFEDPKFQNRYLTRDLKVLCKILFGLEQDEADALTMGEMEKRLLSSHDDLARGLVIEHKVWVVVDAEKVDKKTGKPAEYTKFKTVRVVPTEELIEALGAETCANYGIEAAPAKA